MDFLASGCQLGLLSREHPCSVTQLHPTLSNPMDCGPPGSSVHRLLQARILEWVAISSSRGSSQSRDPSPALVGQFFTTKPSGKHQQQIGKIEEMEAEAFVLLDFPLWCYKWAAVS